MSIMRVLIKSRSYDLELNNQLQNTVMNPFLSLRRNAERHKTPNKTTADTTNAYILLKHLINTSMMQPYRLHVNQEMLVMNVNNFIIWTADDSNLLKRRMWLTIPTDKCFCWFVCFVFFLYIPTNKDCYMGHGSTEYMSQCKGYSKSNQVKICFLQRNDCHTSKNTEAETRLDLIAS